jgi:hypothetical protein
MNLQIAVVPFIISQKHEKQRITVYFNQHKLGDYTFTQPQLQNIEFVVPPGDLNDQIQYLTFSFPDAISPSELEISADSRKLAIALSSFNLTAENSH